MGRLDRLTFRTVVPRAARRADHVLAVSERTKRDVVELLRRRPPDEGDRDAERRRPELHRPAATHDGVPALRRRDPARARTRSPRSTRPAPSGCRSSSPGPRRSRARARAARRRRRPARLRLEGRARRALPRRRRARPPLALRGLRPAGARGDGLRHAGRRRRRAGAARGRGRRGGLRRGRRLRRRRRAARSPSASALSAAGLERAKLFSWAETARRTAEVYRQVLADEGLGDRRLARERAPSSSESLPALAPAGRRAAS